MIRNGRQSRTPQTAQQTLICLLLVTAVVLVRGAPRTQEYVREAAPEMLTYEELVELSQQKNVRPDLANKLHAITTTPFVSNEAYFGGAHAVPLDIEPIGPSLRVAFWNIERGLGLDDIKTLLTDPDRFVESVKEERRRARTSGTRIWNVDIDKIPQQIALLKSAQVWVLNEVDWGVKRTDYRHVVRELGKTLNMNWAFGVEFVEVDPKQLGTADLDYIEGDEARRELLEVFTVDKDRLHALHGNAVLSRYPIRNARLVPFATGYDWFKESDIRPLEKGKRKAAILVGEDLQREVRRGQRTTLFVDLDVPDAPGGRLTVAATHLENRARPSVRRQQMEELLQQVKDTRHPVIVAGDLNTTGGDSNPTSVEYMLYKRYGSLDFWTTKGVRWVSGFGVAYSAARGVRKLAGIQYRVDPTSANLPGLSPNLERGLFGTLEQFRFADGKAFDFRGSPEKTVNGNPGTLANSNERGQKGFVPTFVTELIWGKAKIARFKLDWIFVKSDLERPRDQQGAYRFAPHFPRTLQDLNHFPPEAMSDHSPMTIDLPFREPRAPSAKQD
jgi:endonuclease/exonuclease/phosphatase family metal-dependent hydrolase